MVVRMVFWHRLMQVVDVDSRVVAVGIYVQV